MVTKYFSVVKLVIYFKIPIILIKQLFQIYLITVYLTINFVEGLIMFGQWPQNRAGRPHERLQQSLRPG